MPFRSLSPVLVFLPEFGWQSVPDEFFERWIQCVEVYGVREVFVGETVYLNNSKLCGCIESCAGPHGGGLARSLRAGGDDLESTQGSLDPLKCGGKRGRGAAASAAQQAVRWRQRGRKSMGVGVDEVMCCREVNQGVRGAAGCGGMRGREGVAAAAQRPAPWGQNGRGSMYVGIYEMGVTWQGQPERWGTAGGGGGRRNARE
ncbi:hypothetical protein B0H14DRAFT_2625506 [Mycena olivaceomarginata]|nr:hypothetical protein B0H14DRAFT_2625506 [Mycena olivaceomarginata]